MLTYLGEIKHQQCNASDSPHSITTSLSLMPSPSSASGVHQSENVVLHEVGS